MHQALPEQQKASVQCKETKAAAPCQGWAGWQEAQLEKNGGKHPHTHLAPSAAVPRHFHDHSSNMAHRARGGDAT